MSIRQRLVNWARVKSPWITIFNSGACNACDIEAIAAITPRFDVERFGILAKGSPRHADVLVVTGPVTRKQATRLRRVYEQMPEPKYVLAMGACGSSGGVFRGLYHIVDGVVKCLELMKQDLAHGGKEWRQKAPRPSAPSAPPGTPPKPAPTGPVPSAAPAEPPKPKEVVT